jgi:hypothetical protein
MLESVYFHDNSTSQRIYGSCSVKIPEYDIFSGQFDKDAIWLETVEGLGAACEKMKELAKNPPGPYFVFCQNTHHINTRISEDIQIRLIQYVSLGIGFAFRLMAMVQAPFPP